MVQIDAVQAEVAAIEVEAGVGIHDEGAKAQAFGHHISDPVRAGGDVVDLDAGVVEVRMMVQAPPPADWKVNSWQRQAEF